MTKRPANCGSPEPDEVCMAWSQGGCLECERLHNIWRPIRERLRVKLSKAQAKEFAIQADSEARLVALDKRLWKEAWAEYKTALAKRPSLKEVDSERRS